MKQLSTALLTAALFTASTLCAELKYISYDLANPAADPIAVPVANIKAAEYHTGSTMLFVQDTEISEEYYIGAFEVTVAQARALGWTTTEASGEAYATSKSWAHTIPATLPRLTFPSVAQWQAYAGKPEKPCNVFQGRKTFPYDPFSLSAWYTTYLQEVAANAHGVFDIFGNVAEYTTDKGEFYGGFADSTCKFDALTAESGVAASAVPTTGTNTNLLGARLIYTPPEAQKYTVTVTLNGDPVGTPISAKENDSVSFDEPDLPFGHDLVSRTVTPEVEITGTSFTMPAQNVTIAYVTAPYLTLTVSGGTASKTKVFKGDTVTLTPAPGAYQVFKAWSSPANPESDITEGLSGDGTLTLTVKAIADAEAGTALAYTATFNTCPRVLVYSGTAEVNAAGTAYGEGYYAPESLLTLTASAVPGYKLTGWTITTAGDTTLSGNTVTVGSYNTADAVLSPVYAIDATGSVTNPEVTRIGETETPGDSETVYSARTAIGYVAGGTPSEITVDGNTFVRYSTVDETSDYVAFDTLQKKLVYSTTLPSGSKTTAPTLKRIALKDAQPYYVGIYETTVAHTANLAKALDSKAEVTESDLKDIDPQIYKNGTAAHHTTYFANIKTLFGVEVSLPTYEQIEGITRSGLKVNEDGSKEAFTGAGVYNSSQGYGDKKICADKTDSEKNMVHADMPKGVYLEVGSLQPDPYGFYDLWGNISEMIADGQLRGGHYETKAVFCNLYTLTGPYPSAFPGAFRPAATVPKKLSVTIEGINEPFTVLPDQKILLAPQMKAGKTFTGWQATVGDTTATIEKDAETGRYPYTVTADVKLTPLFSEEVPMITLSYANCTGPERALPGSTTAVYATTPGYKLLSLTLSPETAGKVNEDNTVTFAAEATGAVTVTATYDVPEPAKPGYRFGLR